jgi:transcriptional regulator GlxA family with amidase domain
MSRRNLERSFRGETGSTINEHIVGIRMREASRLLKTQPRAKSAEIATLVGITETGTFFRTFRRYFGMSPGLHRDWAAHSAVTSRAPQTVLHPLAPAPRGRRDTAPRIRSTAA